MQPRAYVSGCATWYVSRVAIARSTPATLPSRAPSMNRLQLSIALSFYTLLAAGTANAADTARDGARDIVDVFAAGSLRGVVAEMSATAATTLHIEVRPTFEGSGSLRERIEKGERP